MTTNILFFPVDNGNMTLIKTDLGNTILSDLRIRSEGENATSDTPNVLGMLRKSLKRDGNGRLYVNVLHISHTDQDHVQGLEKYFHLGPPEEWSKESDKIFVNEIWSSPLFFYRQTKDLNHSEDAKAFNKEAKRRVDFNLQPNLKVENGNRILILGEDLNGKTKDMDNFLLKADTPYYSINDKPDRTFSVRLLEPKRASGKIDEQPASIKNELSSILKFGFIVGKKRKKLLVFDGS